MLTQMFQQCLNVETRRLPSIGVHGLISLCVWMGLIYLLYLLFFSQPVCTDCMPCTLAVATCTSLSTCTLSCVSSRFATRACALSSALHVLYRLSMSFTCAFSFVSSLFAIRASTLSIGFQMGSPSTPKHTCCDLIALII